MLAIRASAYATPFLSIDFGTMGGMKSLRQTDFQYFKDGVGVSNNVALISEVYTGFDPAYTNASGTVTVTKSRDGASCFTHVDSLGVGFLSR